MFKLFTFVLVAAIATLPYAVEGANSTSALGRGGLIPILSNDCKACCGVSVGNGFNVNCNKVAVADFCSNCGGGSSCILQLVNGIAQCCATVAKCTGDQVCQFGVSGGCCGSGTDTC